MGFSEGSWDSSKGHLGAVRNGWGEKRALSLHLAQFSGCRLGVHKPALWFRTLGGTSLPWHSGTWEYAGGLRWGSQKPPGLPGPQVHPSCAAWAGSLSVILETLMRDLPSLPHGMRPRAWDPRPCLLQDGALVHLCCARDTHAGVPGEGVDPQDSPAGAGAPSGAVRSKGSSVRNAPGPTTLGRGGGEVGTAASPGALPPPSPMGASFRLGFQPLNLWFVSKAASNPCSRVGKEPRDPGLFHLLPPRPGPGQGLWRSILQPGTLPSPRCSQEGAGPRPVPVEPAAPPPHLAWGPWPRGGRGTNVLFTGSSGPPCCAGSWALVSALHLLALALSGLRCR